MLGKVNVARDCLDKLDDSFLLNCFNIIGAEYLNGECVYFNNFDGFSKLIYDFNLKEYKVLELMFDSGDCYNFYDEFIVYDGSILWSLNDNKYVRDCVYKHMNGDVADIVLEFNGL